MNLDFPRFSHHRYRAYVALCIRADIPRMLKVSDVIWTAGQAQLTRGGFHTHPGLWWLPRMEDWFELIPLPNPSILELLTRQIQDEPVEEALIWIYLGELAKRPNRRRVAKT